MTAPGDPAAVRLRVLARPLAAIVVCNLALMLAWSVVVPSFRGADEHVHHDLLRHLTQTWTYPDYDELLVSHRTLALLGSSPVYPADAPPARAEQATDRSERAGWADLGPDVRDGPPNQIAQHPPLYYEPTAAIVRAIDPDGTVPLDRVVWELRLLNILTLVGVPLVAADIARRFTSSVPVILSAAATVLAVPQLAHEGATVSNDPLMVLLGSLTLAGVARLLTGDRRWRTAVATGVVAGLALFTKGFAVPLVPAVAIACLLPLWWDRRGEGGAAVVGRSAVVAGLALVFGGWWWIRNIVVFHNPQPGVGLRPRVPVDVDVVHFAGNFTHRLVGSFWGNVGWREAHLPIGLSGLLTVALVLTVGAACWRRWERIVLVVPAAVAGLMVLSAGWGAYRKTGVSYATQGRYLFASIAALAALAVLGLARLTGGRWRRQPVAVLAGALGLQATMLVIAVDRYWAGPGLDRLRALGAFSPLPGPVTTALLVFVPISSVAALVALWWPVSGAVMAPASLGGRPEQQGADRGPGGIDRDEQDPGHHGHDRGHTRVE